MASSLLPQTQSRVSPQMTLLLGMVADVDSYWSYKALGDTFDDVRKVLPAGEAAAFSRIRGALLLLFPFDPDRDMPDTMFRRHCM